MTEPVKEGIVPQPPADAPSAARSAAPEMIPILVLAEDDPLSEALGQPLRGLREQIRRVAGQDTAILLTGETGTGKTRLARYIHEHSLRRAEPFLVVDCGALSPSLIESEMFGHVRGAFTGADRDRTGKFGAAGRGTLLLDEINSLPLPLQSKLLRVVDERVFEPVGGNRPLPLQARLIAVTNVPLEPEVAAQRFRTDLYYRLNVVEFVLPPLRERRSVVLALTRRFLAEFVHRNRPDLQGITPEALRQLECYRWPGNIRELRNVVERIVALSPGPIVQSEDLPEVLRLEAADLPAAAPAAAKEGSLKLAWATEEAEVRRIREALEKHHDNLSRAATELGISRMGLYKKMRRYGLR